MTTATATTLSGSELIAVHTYIHLESLGRCVVGDWRNTAGEEMFLVTPCDWIEVHA